MRTGHFLILVIFLCSLSSISSANDNKDVILEDLDGKPQPLSNYMGNNKWLVLNIWAPQCLPCRKEMPMLQQFHEQHKNHDAIVVGMAVNYPDLNRAKTTDVQLFVSQNNIQFPILLGDQNSLKLPYDSRIAGLPTTILFNPQGKMLAAKVGRVTQKMIEEFIAQYD
ncbi:MAG: TlpA family protein disulfide reductase [Gammaproteobacteria bacterium]|nr:TlpA family protein disulfide reductase [Gammaproteobacteria bacterium]